MTCQFTEIFYGLEEAPEAKELGQKSPEATTRTEDAPGGEGAPSNLVVGSGLFWPNSFASGASSGPSKISVNFQLIWTPFDIPFFVKLKNKKKTETGTGF